MPSGVAAGAEAGLLAGASHGPAPRRLAVAREAWLVAALALIVWEAWVGRAGLSLLIFAAALPLAILPSGERPAGRGLGWALGALAPVLGLAGLAGAFPAVSGQLRDWRQRASLGALAYWWLALAQPLLARRLWLGPPAGTPARMAWESSLTLAASHVLAPLLALGVLLGALLWAAASVVLPWLVQGRSALLDALAAAAWTAALFALEPLLDNGLSTHATHANPRGALLGAILGALLAVCARALRGPV